MNPASPAWRELIGYLASSLVLATFCVRDMASLRAFAIASNLAFISYGWLAGVHPVLALHVLLLPTNVVRLCQLLRVRQPCAAVSTVPGQGDRDGATSFRSAVSGERARVRSARASDRRPSAVSPSAS